jgi:cell division protein ZapA (FtsZ GTPase activity inhibitor)
MLHIILAVFELFFVYIGIMTTINVIHDYISVKRRNHKWIKNHPDKYLVYKEERKNRKKA